MQFIPPACRTAFTAWCRLNAVAASHSTRGPMVSSRCPSSFWFKLSAGRCQNPLTIVHNVWRLPSSDLRACTQHRSRLCSTAVVVPSTAALSLGGRLTGPEEREESRPEEENSYVPNAAAFRAASSPRQSLPVEVREGGGGDTAAGDGKGGPLAAPPPPSPPEDEDALIQELVKRCRATSSRASCAAGS